MEKINYTHLIRTLESIEEKVWSNDDHNELMKALELFKELVLQQTEVSIKQFELLKRIEKYWGDEENKNADIFN